MSNKTRKHIWPGALVMSLAIVGILAALVVLAGNPATTGAHEGPAGGHSCEGQSQTWQDLHDELVGSDDPKCADDPTPTPEPANQAPVLTGTPLADVPLRVRESTAAIDVSVAFTDPDDDTLTYSAVSDNPSVANASIAGSQMTVVAGNFRGTARITVTADDGNGDTAEISFGVTVSEAYTLTADPIRDQARPSTYLVEGLGAYTAKFDLAVGGSEDDVTVTVTASEPAAGGITVTDSDGLIGAGFKDEEETDLEGSLTIKATDAGSRAFEIEGVCERVGVMVTIVVEDKDLDEVARGYIACPPQIVEPPRPDRTDVSDTFTVTSYGDWEFNVVTDGFIDDDPDVRNEHMVNDHHKETGRLNRDEPVHDDYTLGVSDTEMLNSFDDGSPRRAKDEPSGTMLTRDQRVAKNADPEEGQRTVEVLMGRPHVQLTVTSRVAGPAYIRFLDSNMQPFGTDVDEDPTSMWQGADVVGLDSQGRLDLNLMPDLSVAKALAYDQYRIVTPGNETLNSRLTGIDDDVDSNGDGVDDVQFYQGAFRFFKPCPTELGADHHFYVEVYEASGKYLQTRERIQCVSSPEPGPTGLVFEIDSEIPGEGMLSFKRARRAGAHTALLIDASNRNIVREAENAVSPMTFSNLNNGWTYHIVVIAEGAANQYTADAVRDYGVRWLGQADVPLSTAPSATPTRQHALCSVDNAEITALLSDCDTNTAPMAVGTISAQTVMAGQSVIVDVASNFSDADMGDSLTYTAMSSMMSYATVSVTGSMVSVMGVAPGSATITVTATDMHGATAMQTIMVTVTSAELGAPTGVMATVDDSDPAVTNVTITWTNGMNADGHEVGLVDLSDYSVLDHRVTDGATSHTFTNVASGRYMAIVVSTMDADFEYDVDIVTVP